MGVHHQLTSHRPKEGKLAFWHVSVPPSVSRMAVRQDDTARVKPTSRLQATYLPACPHPRLRNACMLGNLVVLPFLKQFEHAALTGQRCGAAAAVMMTILENGMDDGFRKLEERKVRWEETETETRGPCPMASYGVDPCSPVSLGNSLLSEPLLLHNELHWTPAAHHKP